MFIGGSRTRHDGLNIWDACRADYGCGVFRNIPFAAKQLQVAWKHEPNEMAFSAHNEQDKGLWAYIMVK
jgi:hypothetical protein